jgi:hypothetical protein
VEILTAIKDFKKGSYELEWNSKKLDREAEDLVQKTKELQLLRVTKGLQEVLKRGVEAQASPQEQVNPSPPPYPGDPCTGLLHVAAAMTLGPCVLAAVEPGSPSEVQCRHTQQECHGEAAEALQTQRALA